jgi:hypothetical protein
MNITGVRPNRLILGEGAWDTRANAYDHQNNAGANRSASLNLEEFARKLFIDEARIVNTRYQTLATEKSSFLGNSIYAFYTNDEMMKDKPANIKRFVTPIDGNSPFRVYVEEHSKFSDIVITSAGGIRKLVVTAAV